MLPKKIRLTTSLFDQVFKTGKVRHSRSFWLRSVSLPAGLSSRFAVAVSKNTIKTAVLRNRIKRIVYQAIETLGPEVLASQPSVMVIFGLKSDISKMPFAEIVQELKDLLVVAPLSGINILLKKNQK